MEFFNAVFENNLEAAQRAKEMLVPRLQGEQEWNKRGAMPGRGHKGSGLCIAFGRATLCFPFAKRPSLCLVPMIENERRRIIPDDMDVTRWRSWVVWDGAKPELSRGYDELRYDGVLRSLASGRGAL